MEILWLLLAVVFLVVKWAVSPMAIPAECVAEEAREKSFSLVGVFLALCGWFACIALILMVVHDFHRHIQERRKGKTRPHPYFPAISMGELMGMMLAIAIFPMMIFGNNFELGSRQDSIGPIVLTIGSAVAIFPLLFVIAFNRLNARKVPHGIWRTLYVSLFPLMVFAITAQVFAVNVALKRSDEIPIVQICLGLGVVLLETHASFRASRLGKPQ